MPVGRGEQRPTSLHTQGAGHSSWYHSEPGPGPELLTAVPASQTHPDAYLVFGPRHSGGGEYRERQEGA